MAATCTWLLTPWQGIPGSQHKSMSMMPTMALIEGSPGTVCSCECLLQAPTMAWIAARAGGCCKENTVAGTLGLQPYPCTAALLNFPCWLALVYHVGLAPLECYLVLYVPWLEWDRVCFCAAKRKGSTFGCFEATKSFSFLPCAQTVWDLTPRHGCKHTPAAGIIAMQMDLQRRASTSNHRLK